MGVLLTLQFVGVAILLQPYFVSSQDITTCVYDPNSCSCETNKGRIELSRASTGTQYDVINPITTDQYYWSPCTDFTLNGITAGAVQYVPTTFITFSLGTHAFAFSNVKDGYARFNMNGGDKQRSTYVKCVCGSGDSVVFESEDPKLSYNFAFYSKVCCLESGSGISAGSIIIIAFVSLCVVYVLFGTIFQIAVRKAQGRERIPNIALWSSFPGLVKEGFLFTFTCMRKVGYRKM